jgi:hypothetical protein
MNFVGAVAIASSTKVSTTSADTITGLYLSFLILSSIAMLSRIHLKAPRGERGSTSALPNYR